MTPKHPYYNGTQRFLAAQYGVSYSTVEDWARKYKEFGEKGFAMQSGNASYSAEFKLKCVESYLRGENSLDDIVIKYKISAKRVLQSWIQRYNANKELKDYHPKREVYMADARRKTTLEERKEITEYCIAHNDDYKDTAADKAIDSNPDAKPIFHSDRGFQYTSPYFQTKVLKQGMEQSMSRVAHCIDNGPTEGFWGIIKSEMYYLHSFQDERSLRSAIEKYSHFYNVDGDSVLPALPGIH